MDIWDKDKRTFTEPNELHNEEAMEGMFKITGLTALYLDQDPQAVLENKMGNCDKADLQKSYAQAQGKGYETSAISSIPRQVGRKLQTHKKKATQLGFNISPAEDPFIKSGLTQESA